MRATLINLFPTCLQAAIAVFQICVGFRESARTFSRRKTKPNVTVNVPAFRVQHSLLCFFNF